VATPLPYPTSGPVTSPVSLGEFFARDADASKRQSAGFIEQFDAKSSGFHGENHHKTRRPQANRLMRFRRRHRERRLCQVDTNPAVVNPTSLIIVVRCCRM